MSDALSDQSKSYANLVESQIKEKRANVEANTKAFLAEQERKRSEELKANIDYEAQAKRDNEQARIQEWNELSLGMNDVQKALLKEWLGVASQLASSQQQIGYKDTKKLKARYDALLKEICKDGRHLGTTYFRPVTVYTNDNGLMLLPNDSGRVSLHKGSFNAIALPNDDRSVEFSETGLPTKLVRYGHIANNIPIKEWFDVEIELPTGNAKVEGTQKSKTIPHKPLYGVKLINQKGDENFEK